MDFLQRTPFFRLAIPLISGIILYQYVELFHWSLIVLFVISFIFIVLSFLISESKRQFQFRWFFGLGISIFFFTLAYVLSAEQEQADAFDHLQQNGIYRVELTAAPSEKANSYSCRVGKIQYFNTVTNSFVSARGQALLYFQKDSAASKLLYGDRLMVRAEFIPPEKVANPDGFDYRAYLKRQGIGATCYISSGNWELTGHSTSFSVRREADKCRNYLLNIYRRFKIHGDEFAVLSALTLGYTDDLQPDLRKSYSATGVMHILSVSGMHVSVVYVVIAFLLSFLNKSRWQKVMKSVLIVLFLWAYAFLSGMSPAVFRAALMFSFVAFADCLERKSLIYNTIFMSAVLMLLYNPNFLFDVGFQLSYSAVLSIILFQPTVSKWVRPKKKLSVLTWDLLAVSIAAQLGTAPFTLYYFQQFPNYFLLTNLIAIPLSSVIIYLAMALFAVSFIPYLSTAVAFLLNKSLWALNFSIVSIQNFPYSTLHISFDIRQMIIVFMSIFFLSGYFYTKKYSYFIVGLLSILIAVSFNLQVKYKTLTTKRLIVFSSQKQTHINFIHGAKNYVFSTDSTEAVKIAGTFWQNQKLDKPVFVKNNSWLSDGFACFEGSRILILTPDLIKRKTISIPFELDYLIIGNGLKPKIEQVMESVHPRKIIVDKTISKWYAEQIKKVCRLRKIGFYSVADQGAFILNISD
jgi:competence protein ComEC